MAVPEFLRALVEHGRVRVGSLPPLVSEAEWRAAVDELRHWDAACRLDFAGEAPAFDEEVARWAIERFYLACLFAVHRDVEAPTIAAAFATECPAAGPASQHYTIDLLFRHLPELYRLARSAAADDPLCEHLRHWGRAWPLSSVGMPDVNQTTATEVTNVDGSTGPSAETPVNPLDVTPLCKHSGLLRAYVDRIIARGDTSRLADARVRRAVRAALGHFESLTPPIAAALKKLDEAPLAPTATP